MSSENLKLLSSDKTCNENLSDFLHHKFFSLNYLIKEKYKVGDECDLQYNILEEIEENDEEIDREFYDYAQEDILDVIMLCAEYCRSGNRCEDFTEWMFYQEYHACTSLVLREKVDEFFDDDEKVEMINKMITAYNECIFKLAINKLKRNKLVNAGFLLKVSIMNCGLF